MMRLAFEDALRRSPSHPLAPAVKRGLSRKEKQFGGWSTDARKRSKSSGKRRK